jgi:lactate dehydrogenase-like 2-hydroxyacid dehydrogenase
MVVLFLLWDTAHLYNAARLKQPWDTAHLYNAARLKLPWDTTHLYNEARKKQHMIHCTPI